MKKKLIYWLYRIKYFIRHGRGDYDKPGFTQLTYRGVPITIREDVPFDELWFITRVKGHEKVKIPARRKAKLTKLK